MRSSKNVVNNFAVVKCKKSATGNFKQILPTKFDMIRYNLVSYAVGR